MVQGKYQIRPKRPFTPGSEFAGIVESVGPGVTKVKPGDRVYGALAYGAFSSLVSVKEAEVWPIPNGMSFEQAAAWPMCYATSYLALVDRAKLCAGETVLVHAAAGGVGLAAVQIAKALGATVIGTAGSEEKCKVVRELGGADHVINYRAKNTSGKGWVRRVKQLTGGRGVDVVYDPVGGDTTLLSTSCMAWKTGRLLVVGFAAGTIAKLPVNRLLLKNISAIGVFLGSHMMNEPQSFPRIMDALDELYKQGKLNPVIYPASFTLETLADGLKTIASRKSYGKVVLSVGEGKGDKLQSRL